MTYRQFLRVLRKVARDFKWRLDENAIRTNDDHCPITAVCKAIMGVDFEARRYAGAAGLLKMDLFTIANVIVNAADGAGWEWIPGEDQALKTELDDRGKKIRQKLLAAVGLG